MCNFAAGQYSALHHVTVDGRKKKRQKETDRVKGRERARERASGARI